MGFQEGENNTQGSNPSEGASIQDLINLVKKQQQQIDNLTKNQQQPNTIGAYDADGLAKIIRAVKESEKDIDYNSGITTEQVPEDDFDEVGVMFTAPYLGYCIADDVRKGHRVKLPYGKPRVFFEYITTRRYQQGRYETIIPCCTYKSHSKKEIAWLKDHSMFNVQFYATLKDAMTADGEKIQRMGQIMLSLNGMEVHDLIKRGKEYGVAYDADPKIMRANLAVKMLEKEFEQQQNKAKDRLLETEKEKLIIKQ